MTPKPWFAASLAMALASLSSGCGDDAGDGAGGSGSTATTSQGSPTATVSSASATSSQSATASSATGGSSCGDGLCAATEDAVGCCADCGICDDAGTVTMHTGVAGGAPRGGVTPGGMVDTHAQFDGDGFGELVFPMMVSDEPVEGTSYFWAQQFFFDGTGDGGYTGMQTGGIANGSVVGKMLIFSMWNALSAVPGPDATCEPFGGEGIGQSCRLPFEWREKVVYRFAVRFVTDHQWSVSAADPTLPGERLLGTIVVPDAWGKLRPPTAGFTEYFGGVASCTAIPEATAMMFSPTADGASPTAVSTSVYGDCAAQAESSCAGALCQ